MFKITAEAKDIPIGSKVRPLGETFQTYILINEIQVIADGKTHENYAHEDSLFIMSENNIGSLKVVKPTESLQWIVKTEEDFDQLEQFLTTEEMFVLKKRKA